MLPHVLSTRPGWHAPNDRTQNWGPEKWVLVATCVARDRRLGGSDREVRRTPVLGLRPVALGWQQAGASAGDPTSFFRFPNVYDLSIFK